MNSFQALRKALGLDVARQSEAPVRTSDTACSRRGFGKSAWPSRDLAGVEAAGEKSS